MEWEGAQCHCAHVGCFATGPAVTVVGRSRVQFLHRETNVRGEKPIKIKSELKSSLPLEVIFKNIHSTMKMPFIKFNPGNRRENIYRLYTEKKTNNGKHIPYLSESMILKLSKEIGKKKQISFFIQYNETEDGQTIPIYINLDTYGDVSVYAELKTPISNIELTQLFQNAVNPVIENINEFLQQTGYTIQTVNTLREQYIEVVNINSIYILF